MAEIVLNTPKEAEVFRKDSCGAKKNDRYPARDFHVPFNESPLTVLFFATAASYFCRLTPKIRGRYIGF